MVGLLAMMQTDVVAGGGSIAAAVLPASDELCETWLASCWN